MKGGNSTRTPRRCSVLTASDVRHKVCIAGKIPGAEIVTALTIGTGGPMGEKGMAGLEAIPTLGALVLGIGTGDTMGTIEAGQTLRLTSMRVVEVVGV
jgi:hypothetical protein